MAAAVLNEINTWFRANVFAPLRDGPDPRAAIRHMLEGVESYFLSGRRVCLVDALALRDARDRFVGQVRGYFVEWGDALAGALTRTGHEPAAAAVLAEEAVAVIQDALVLARARRRASVLARARPTRCEAEIGVAPFGIRVEGTMIPGQNGACVSSLAPRAGYVRRSCETTG